jgi:hypothetical protein
VNRIKREGKKKTPKTRNIGKRKKEKKVASRKNKRTTGIFKQPTQPAAQKPEARKKKRTEAL